MTQKTVSATGLSGMLMYSGNGTYFFRVNAEDGSYKDYDIFHWDMEITITDTDAFIYPSTRNGMDGFIDYSPTTLSPETVGLDPL